MDPPYPIELDTLTLEVQSALLGSVMTTWLTSRSLVACDAKPDGCTPCVRARRVCPGYRAQVDLLFRDQSESVIQKAKAREAGKKGLSSSKSTPSSSESTQEDSAEGLSLVTQDHLCTIFSLQPTLEERATGYFEFHYLVGIQAPSRDLLNNLALLYRSNAVDESLLTAVKAVSFASYAHHAQSTSISECSRYQYTTAISLTNRALRDPVRAIKDSTLLAIMILGMYEILTGSNRRSLEAWMEHVRGSSALLKLRGEDQIKRPAGRRLFIQASTGILTSCVQLNIPVPRHITETLKRIPTLMDPTDEFAHRSMAIHQIFIDINQFRAAIEKRNISNPRNIIEKALAFDGSLAAVSEEPPSELQYHTVRTTADSAIAFNGVYHVYFDLLTANVWNAIRVFRGLLHQQIRGTLLQGFSAKPPTFTQPADTLQFQISTDVCLAMQADILASVPQHLGYVRKSAAWKAPSLSISLQGSEVSRFSSPAAFSGLSGLNEANHTYAFIPSISRSGTRVSPDYELLELPEPRASGGYNLIWPLWFAGSMDLASKEVQHYAAKMLREIGSGMGIQQAFMLANIVEKKVDFDVANDRARFETVDED